MVTRPVRGNLKPKPKVKIGKIQQIKNLFKSARAKSRQIRKAEWKLEKLNAKLRGKAREQVYYKTLAQALLPSIIEHFNTHIEFNHRDIARSLIFGIPTIDMPSYPDDLGMNTFNEFQKLAAQGRRIMLSSKISKIPPTDAEKNLEQSWRHLNIQQEKARMVNPGGSADMAIENKLKAVRNEYDGIWYRAENDFHTQVILTMLGSEEEVLNSESLTWTKASEKRIGKFIPENRQLEAFCAAQLSPFMDGEFIVKAPSSVAACLVAATNVNTPCDETGVWFAVQKETWANLIFDPRLLGAMHGIWFGATGSGKTYSAHTFLMRLKDMLDFRIVYMSRKEPDRRAGAFTDYEAVAKFYEDEAATIIVGDRNSRINPLHIIANYKTMQAGDYSRVWDDTRRGIKLFFKCWLEGELSPNMAGMLEDALDHEYDVKGIKRNDPKTWQAKKIPTLVDLRQYWLDIMKDKEGQMFEDRRAAGALYRKTRDAKPGGAMEYLLGDEDGKTNFDFTKEWITISLHQADKTIQDALYVLISTQLGIYFNFDTKRDTIIFVDEARALLRNHEMCDFLLDTITMGRTKGVGLILATQQPADLLKAGVKEEMSTNMRWGVVMGYGLDEQSAQYVQQYFGFSDEIMMELLKCQPGEGVFKKRDTVTPVRFKAIPLEEEILNNKYNVVKPETVSGYRVKEAYLKKGIDGRNFIEKNGFMLKEMIEGSDLPAKEYAEIEAAILADGWSKRQEVIATGGKGTTKLYYKPGSLTPDLKYVTEGYNGYGTHSKEHLSITLQDAVYIIEKGLKASVNVNNRADIEFEWIDSKGKINIGAVEVELSGGHKSKEELAGKVARIIPYDDYRIITDDPGMFDGLGVPAGKIIPRGKEFSEWIDSLIEESKTPAPSGGFEVKKSKINQATVSLTEEPKQDIENQSIQDKDRVDSEGSEVGLRPELDLVKSGAEEIGAF